MECCTLPLSRSLSKMSPFGQFSSFLKSVGWECCHSLKLLLKFPENPLLQEEVKSVWMVQWRNSTGVKQCTFHGLIFSKLVQKKRVFNSSIIHRLIMINYDYHHLWIFICHISTKIINIAPLLTWVICVTVSDGICNMNYKGFNLNNINALW